MILRVLNDLRCPNDTTAGVVAAEKGHDHSVIGADIFKTTEDTGWNVEDIALFQRDLACITPAPPEKSPFAFEHKKYFSGAVHM